MKRFSLVLLSVLMCVSMFSCDDYTHISSTSSEIVSDISYGEFPEMEDEELIMNCVEHP